MNNYPHSNGHNLPAIPLEDLPGTVQFAQKHFQNQNIFDHYDGEFAHKYNNDEIAHIAREVKGLHLRVLKLERKAGTR